MFRRERIRPSGAETPALRGSLSLMGLPALLSHLEAERRTGRLTLLVDGLPSTIDVREGRLMRARVLGKSGPRGAELIYQLLPLASGVFEFRPYPVEGAGEIDVPVTALLLEGARRLDELAPAGSNPDRPFRTVSGSPGGSTV